MAQNFPAEEATKLSSLVGDIITDAQKLVRQEMALAKAELDQKWKNFRTTFFQFGLTLVAATTAGLLFAFTVVYALNEEAGLPMWLSFGVVAAGLSAMSFVLYRRARGLFDQISFLPQQTVETFKENVTWIRNQK